MAETFANADTSLRWSAMQFIPQPGRAEIAIVRHGGLGALKLLYDFQV